MCEYVFKKPCAIFVRHTVVFSRKYDVEPMWNVVEMLLCQWQSQKYGLDFFAIYCIFFVLFCVEASSLSIHFNTMHTELYD